MSSTDRLTPLQRRLIVIMARIRPQGVLTGGAALAAVFSGDRATRDLDWLWRGEQALGPIPDKVRASLRREGLQVDTLQTSPSFVRLRVGDGVETVVLDLVADPTPGVEVPRVVRWEGVDLQVDTLHEILVNKLCALLGRAEVRDLYDVRALLARGGDLRRAVRDAPKKDGGFSPLVLAWVLRELPVASLALASGWLEDSIRSLESFRDQLVDDLVSLGTPQE